MKEKTVGNNLTKKRNGSDQGNHWIRLTWVGMIAAFLLVYAIARLLFTLPEAQNRASTSYLVLESLGGLTFLLIAATTICYGIAIVSMLANRVKIMDILHSLGPPRGFIIPAIGAGVAIEIVVRLIGYWL